MVGEQEANRAVLDFFPPFVWLTVLRFQPMAIGFCCSWVCGKVTIKAGNMWQRVGDKTCLLEACFQ